MARIRYVLNPLTGFFDAVEITPPDYITAVADTATIDLTVTAGVLTADLITAPGLTGTPLTLARYDNLGNLVSSNYWLSYDDGQISGGSTLFTDNGSALNIQTDIQLATTINNINLYAGGLTNNGTLTGYSSLLNLGFTNTGTTDFINGTNIGLTGDTVADKQYASYYSSGVVGGNFSGTSQNINDVVTGAVSFHSINRTGATTLSTTILNTYFSPTATMGGNLTGLNVGIDADINDYGILVNLNAQGDILKGFSVVNANFAGNIGDGTGTSLIGLNLSTQNTTTIDGGLFGVSVANSATLVGNNTVYGLYINNQGGGYRHVGATSLNNADQSEEIRGFEHNTVGDSRTSTGLDIYMDGNATDDAQGIRINVQNQTSTNNRVRSIDAQGHTWSFNNVYRPTSGLFVDTANNNFSEYRIASGSPVTGTDVLANNNIVAYLLEDDQALGPVGLGAVTLNSISLLGVADTKQIDLIRGMLVVGSAQDPGYADSGVVDRFEGIVYAGVAAGGGSTTVNEAVGLYMPAGFDSYAGTNWGLLVDGTTADNYVNKLAVGTTSKTSGAGLLIDSAGEIGVTTAGSGISIQEGSNARMGVAVLVAGTVTVSTTAVQTGDRIFLTRTAASGTIGALSVENIINATSFRIDSTDSAETSTVEWIIVRPA